MRARLLYACTIFWSSALLFVIQPMMARVLLPWFGGSAGVWTTCMLFFQTLLLAGYLYAHRVARRFIHAGLLVCSLILLPVQVSAAWKPIGADDPVQRIIGLLFASIGLPYFLLASTGPLLQSWLARRAPGHVPYRLFALSNAGSLLALLAYPPVVEPLMTLKSQLATWSAAYAGFVVLSGTIALFTRHGSSEGKAAPEDSKPLVWMALAACASVLWLAVASHLSQQVAPIPFLWIIPLSLYLLSFILCFDRAGWYSPRVWRWLLPAAWIAICVAYSGGIGLKSDILLISAALFVCCMFCHGELARSKPVPQSRALTGFYLWIALGGAAGAVFVGLIAPHVFSEYVELPLGVAACILLALALLYGFGFRKRLLRLAVVAAIALVAGIQLRGRISGERLRVRDFYGTLLVKDSRDAVRFLYSGAIEHGAQFLAADRSRLTTAYYGPDSGAAVAIRAGQKRAGERVGAIGLGAGTLAAYGRPGDYFRFYELDPAVIRVAQSEFHFLKESRARVDVIAGDGRLSLEREPDQRFDALIVDAFTSDAIPVHLLTREAFELYVRHLEPDGILAVHVTNKYLDLTGVVAAQAQAAGKSAVVIRNPADPSRAIREAIWVLVSGVGASRPARRRVWTDDFSNLFQALR